MTTDKADMTERRLPPGLDDEDAYAELVRAARPLWDALGALGWVDDWGGAEFHRVFPDTLHFIHREANKWPQIL